jgi:hypothetical protein
MLNLIEKLWSAFKDLLKSQPAELFETLFLLFVALGGLFIAVLDVVGYPFAVFKDPGDVTLVLVALLALHFCIERFTVMHRVEKRLEFLDIVGTKEIPPKMKSMVNTFVGSHVKLQELRSHSKHDNAHFPSIVDKILNEQVRQLRELSKGKLNVPSAQKANFNRELMKLYVKRFDAVSEDDLKYWADMKPDAAAYFDVGAEAIARKDTDTVVTRIFILTLDDLNSQADKVVKVLVRHQKAGIGWGVAIQEELDSAVTSAGITPDFALYDVDRAVSPKDTDKRFETIFATHENNGRISEYIKLYRLLVSECWLVNKQFAENYSGALGPSESLEHVKKKCERNNKKLNDNLGRPVTEDAVFVLVTSNPDEVPAKVELLVKIVNEYRDKLGK